MKKDRIANNNKHCGLEKIGKIPPQITGNNPGALLRINPSRIIRLVSFHCAPRSVNFSHPQPYGCISVRPCPLRPVPLLFFIAICSLLIAHLSCALGEDPDVLRERNAHYTVSFIANGGMPVPEKQNVKSGGKIGLVPVMSKTGYSFAGWYRDADFSVKWDFAGNTVKKNTALFAKWEANSYTVAYFANDGTGTMASSTHVYDEAKPLNTCAFTRSGYAFAGWVRDTESAAVEFTDGQSVINLTPYAGGTVELYALWGAHPYFVAYDANGGSGEMENSAFAYGISQSLRPNAFTRTGYTFAGWAGTEDGAAEFADGQNVEGLTESSGTTVTLFAQWEPTAYAVAYNKNAAGAGGAMENSSHVYDEAKSLNANAFTYTGYAFAGWARTEGGPAEFADKESVLNLADEDNALVTLYAQWVLNRYTVTFNSNGGSAVEPILNVGHGSVIGEPAAPVKTGFVFDAWYGNEGLTVLYNFSAPVTANLTLYARWLDSGSIGASINSIPAPAIGATPATAITETAQYAGTVSWSPAHSVFAPGTVYTATITLAVKEGYSLQGIPANYFSVLGAEANNAANSGLITAVFPATSATVSLAAIQGVAAPAAGATPVTAITETAQYTGTVSWSPNHATFAAGTQYTASITVIPKEGFALQGVPANFFTAAGAAASNAGNSGVVTAVFPATAATVSLAAIQGVAAPAAGATPVTVITETAQYTGTVVWSPNHATFAAVTTYSADITIIPKAGYTVYGVPVNFFIVAGAQTSNLANSGSVTAVFPATAPIAVTERAVQGIPAPVAGAAPAASISANSQFTGTVAWSPNDLVFAPATVYTATVTLTPTAAYTFQGVPGNVFTVAGAANVTNPANSGTVTAVFPATAATVSIAAIMGVTPPVAGVAPVTAVMETAQYTGTVAWSPNHLVFAVGTVYTATVTLTPKAGFTVYGVAGDFFTVAGAESVGNAANSGVVTAVFPATAATITIASIPGVTPPVIAATPVTAITETSQYTGTVAWSPNHATFAAETEYTAVITLFPKAGFTLFGVAADFFTVAGVASEGNAANSGIVMAIFPATSITTSKGFEMIHVAGGSFVLGKELGTAGSGDTTPTSTVTLSGFYIGKYQVTQEQWQAVMEGNGNNISATPSYFSSNPASGEVQGMRPVEQVSWYDAIVFCNRLSVMEGLNPAYSINGSTDPAAWGNVPTDSNGTWNEAIIETGSTGYRLPTEAQWEYAAKGGASQGAYTYSGSNDPDAVGWYRDNSGVTTHEVGKKQANGLGLYDMSGNVWEWCWDWNGSYTGDPKTDPVGASSGAYRMWRGGDWLSGASALRSVYRSACNSPYYRNGGLGFRLARPE